MSAESVAGLESFAFAFIVSGTVANTFGFIHYAVARRAPSWPDRVLFVVLVAALSGYAIAAAFAHDYGRALVCALIIALYGAAARAALARAPRPARHESAPPGPDGTFTARCTCPQCRSRPYH